jgi:ParB family chromosome partitioning protein
LKVIELPLAALTEASWNANKMDGSMMIHLRESIRRYGLVENLVVRPLGERYEVLSGNQRLEVIRELGFETGICVVVELGDNEAKLLSQALNHIHGTDDLGLRAEIMRDLMKKLDAQEIMLLLPETASSLQLLASLGKADIRDYLQNFQQAQQARLYHLQFQITNDQRDVIEQALSRLMPTLKRGRSPNANLRGIALHELCKRFIEGGKKHGK